MYCIETLNSASHVAVISGNTDDDDDDKSSLYDILSLSKFLELYLSVRKITTEIRSIEATYSLVMVRRWFGDAVIILKFQPI